MAPPAAPVTGMPTDDERGPAGGARPAGPQALTTILRAPVAAETWRAYLYLLVGAPLALAAFLALATATWTAVILSVVLIGIPLLALIVLAAREYAAVPRALARRVLGEDAGTPRRRPRTGRGPSAWLRASLGDVDGWRAIAYIVVSFPVTVVGAYVTLVATAMAVVAATYPI